MERIVIGILIITILAGCTAFGNPYANDIFIVDQNLTQNLNILDFNIQDINGIDLNVAHLWDANTLNCSAVATTPSGELVCTTISSVSDINNTDVNLSLIYDVNLLDCEAVATTPAGELVCTTMTTTADINGTDINVSLIYDMNLLGCDVVATTPAGELVCDTDATGSGSTTAYNAGANLFLRPDTNTFDVVDGNLFDQNRSVAGDYNFTNIGIANRIYIPAIADGNNSIGALDPTSPNYLAIGNFYSNIFFGNADDPATYINWYAADADGLDTGLFIGGDVVSFGFGAEETFIIPNINGNASLGALIGDIATNPSNPFKFKTIFLTQGVSSDRDVNALNINTVDLNVDSGIISDGATQYPLTDLNRHVTNVCSGDANSVENSQGVCLDATGWSAGGVSLDANNTWTGVQTFNPFGTGDINRMEFDINVGGIYGGCIQLGLYRICDINNVENIPAGIDLNRIFTIQDTVEGDNNVSFALITQTRARFLIPEEGFDLATYNARSFMVGGDLGNILNNGLIKCSEQGYDKIDCDTDGTGADLGVQDDLQVRGDIFVEGQLNEYNVADFNRSPMSDCGTDTNAVQNSEGECLVVTSWSNVGTGQRMITQAEWDDNFAFWWGISFDNNFSSRFKPDFDGNFNIRFQEDFDGNFNIRFQNDFDGNFNDRFQTDFDGNFQQSFDGNKTQIYTDLRVDIDSNSANAYNCDNNASCITGAETKCDAGEFLTGAGICEPIAGQNFLPHHVLLSTGNLISGDVNSMRILDDGEGYAIDEVTGVSGFIIDLNYITVTAFNEITIHHFYDGSAGHTINIELYNFDSGVYDDFGDMDSSADFITTQINIPDSTNYIDSDGNTNLRFDHITSGNPTHDLNVDWAVLQFMFGGLIVSDHGGLSGLSDNDHNQYVQTSFFNDWFFGLYYPNFMTNFDGNFQASFDSNIAVTNLSQLVYDADFNAAFPAGGGGGFDGNVYSLNFFDDSNVYIKDFNLTGVSNPVDTNKIFIGSDPQNLGCIDNNGTALILKFGGC